MEGVLSSFHLLFITFKAVNQIYNIAGLTIRCTLGSKFLASHYAVKPDAHLDVRTGVGAKKGERPILKRSFAAH